MLLWTFLRRPLRHVQLGLQSSSPTFVTFVCSDSKDEALPHPWMLFDDDKISKVRLVVLACSDGQPQMFASGWLKSCMFYEWDLCIVLWLSFILALFA